jgi:hypothetical protein
MVKCCASPRQRRRVLQECSRALGDEFKLLERAAVPDRGDSIRSSDYYSLRELSRLRGSAKEGGGERPVGHESIM